MQPISKQPLFLQNPIKHVEQVDTQGDNVIPLIGRRKEWQQLQTIWQNVVHGGPQVIVISGAMGIGKHRLATELATWTMCQGFATAQATCYASERRPAYAPIVNWFHSSPLQQAFRHLDPIWQTELTRLFPELSVTQPQLQPQPLLPNRYQRRRLYTALAQLIHATRQPLLLLLDNLQWCDGSTLEWLHFLLRDEPAPGILLLATLRESDLEDDHPLHAWRLDLQNEKRYTELILGPLNRDDTAALATALTGKEFQLSWIERLYLETEGNPLFVTDIVRRETLIDSAPKRPTSKPVCCHDSFARILSPPLCMALAAHINLLSLPARDVISLAAIIGPNFSYDILATAAHTDEETLVMALDEAWQQTDHR